MVTTKVLFVVAGLVFFAGCSAVSDRDSLVQKIEADSNMEFVKQKAQDIMTTGFNAGDSYGEVWIRDYNTFINLALEVHDSNELKENLRAFFKFQGGDGNIIDGFIPIEKAQGGYDYVYSDLEPDYAGHKNTVETDQETSLIQAVYKYVNKTGDTDFLDEQIGDHTVSERMLMAIDFLKKHRFSDEYGLIWGATTADWGDVQPEHDWGVYITHDSHLAIDIYDNAMLLIALKNLAELLPDHAGELLKMHGMIAQNTMNHLWDEEKQKFIPHLYLEDSPFPEDFNENKIYQHGGTAVAIEAGLLNDKQIKGALETMIQNKEAAAAASIGLTLYPPYPEGFFKNEGMGPFSYQNGGDWTWFGGRMILQLIRYGYMKEAYEQARPMLERVKENNGFYEWYTVDNKPQGSGTFRGSAGVLYDVVVLLENWVQEQNESNAGRPS